MKASFTTILIQKAKATTTTAQGTAGQGSLSRNKYWRDWDPTFTTLSTNPFLFFSPISFFPKTAPQGFFPSIFPSTLILLHVEKIVEIRERERYGYCCGAGESYWGRIEFKFEFKFHVQK